MILRRIFPAALLLGFAVVVPRAYPAIVPLPSPVASNTPSPRIQFASPSYDFGRVKAGDPVKHTYTFSNVGDQVLEVTGVSACHCITVGDFTQKVDPGQTGVIPIQFDSTAGSGLRTLTINSNDKFTPVAVLQFSGTVWKPIESDPAFPILTLQPDDPSTSKDVTITNTVETPLHLYAPVCENKSFEAVLKTNQLGRSYGLTITARPPMNPANIVGNVNIKTSSAEMPVYTVQFMVNVIPTLAIAPPQLVLPQVPITTPVTPAVTVSCNSTNPLHLSEASVNLPGVVVEVKEMQTNKVFNIQLTFPPGSQIPPGQQVALTAKTSLPQTPQLRVPISQMPPAAVAPPPAPSPAPPPPANVVPSPLRVPAVGPAPTVPATSQP
jgi:hypothetical protein